MSARFKAVLDGEDDWTITSLLQQQGLELRRLAIEIEDTVTLEPTLSFPASDKRDDTRYQCGSPRRTVSGTGS